MFIFLKEKNSPNTSLKGMTNTRITKYILTIHICKTKKTVFTIYELFTTFLF